MALSFMNQLLGNNQPTFGTNQTGLIGGFANNLVNRIGSEDENKKESDFLHGLKGFTNGATSGFGNPLIGGLIGLGTSFLDR